MHLLEQAPDKKQSAPTQLLEKLTTAAMRPAAHRSNTCAAEAEKANAQQRHLIWTWARCKAILIQLSSAVSTSKVPCCVPIILRRFAHGGEVAVHFTM